MAGDLERFLQQAAERLKQKMEQGNKPRPAAPPPPPIRQAERRPQRLEPKPVHGEIVEAQVVGGGNSARELGPDPLSSLDTLTFGPTEVDNSDERMLGHVNEVFDHEVMHLQKASSALSGGAGQTGKGSQVTKRQHQVSPLVEMLRKPATLRAAFIASEIFTRKF